MARYRFTDTQPRLLAVDLSRRLLPRTFKRALNHLLDLAIDLSRFDVPFRMTRRALPRIRQRCRSRWCSSRIRRASSAVDK